MKRSNYAESTLLAGEDSEEGSSKKGRARQTISDKRNLNILGSSAAAKKKKSTMNVRSALLYRKNLATLIEESVRNATCSPRSDLMSSFRPVPEYCISATICSYVLDCAHTSVRVPSANAVFCVWILGGIQMSPVCHAIL